MLSILDLHALVQGGMSGVLCINAIAKLLDDDDAGFAIE